MINPVLCKNRLRLAPSSTPPIAAEALGRTERKEYRMSEMGINLVALWIMAKVRAISPAGRTSSPGERERGDVPGWVMVTIMTAALVVFILGFFEEPLKNAVTGALKQVTNAK
ncbi:hypothetical protein M6D93_05730 [Jatrophihabitans telluris]|uniref:Uncharacterized protein n=1 Tax=Jatrophihabitans telluris TaxID=2038343 RepID=A0ABY4R2W1_9ACTN|nr:hypothetical protein [Jatrophihabitans telluris]UQX89506.1 hypothetical protein M6D93_05730 [Jatrophihabitans telluris]